MIAPIDDLLVYDAFLGYESRFWAGSAALGSIPHHPLYQMLVDRYVYEEKIEFLSNPFSVHAFSAAMRLLYKVKFDGKFKVVENIALLPEPYFLSDQLHEFKNEKRSKHTGNSLLPKLMA